MKENISVEQHVYNTLKSGILSRKLAPGSQLVEIPISEKLKISRTPVRNAIRKLAADGLVTIIPNKGAFVVNPTKTEVKQAYHLRKDLELIAVRLAIHLLLPGDFERLHQSLTNEVQALEQKSLTDYLEANKNFHMIIAEKSGNKFLIEFIERLINETNIYLILFDTFFEEHSYVPTSTIEHKDILFQLEQKDLIKVEELLHAHFENSIKSLAIQGKGYQTVENLF